MVGGWWRRTRKTGSSDNLHRRSPDEVNHLLNSCEHSNHLRVVLCDHFTHGLVARLRLLALCNAIVRSEGNIGGQLVVLGSHGFQTALHLLQLFFRMLTFHSQSCLLSLLSAELLRGMQTRTSSPLEGRLRNLGRIRGFGLLRFSNDVVVHTLPTDRALLVAKQVASPSRSKWLVVVPRCHLATRWSGWIDWSGG